MVDLGNYRRVTDKEIETRILKKREELVDQVRKSGYKVFKASKESDDTSKPHKVRETRSSKVTESNPVEELKEAEVDLTDSLSSKEALFALVGIRMMNLSQKYGRPLSDLHNMFYSVSCDWT